MDPNTGDIFELKITDFDAAARGLVPVKRLLTPKEVYEKQIKLYSPCVCGSGKKFKFCCKKSNTESFGPVGLLDIFPMLFRKQRKEQAALMETVNEAIDEAFIKASANVG